MIRCTLVCLAVLAAAGCARHDEVGVVRQDSLLTTPSVADTHSHSVSLGNGLIVDSSRVDAPGTLTLARFSPKRVLAIYEAYRPLRRPDIGQTEIDSFLLAQKISITELHAVLEQGDRLGWSAPTSSAKP